MLINMDKRKKKTSVNQYTIYLQMLEDDEIFRTGVLPDSIDISYIPRRWKELTNKLNACEVGPQLSPGQWKKRLMDWKHTTRSKFRRSTFKPAPGKSRVTITALERRAIGLWGKPLPDSKHSLKLKDEEDNFEEEPDEYLETSDEKPARVIENLKLNPKDSNHEVEIEIDEIEERELTDNTFFDVTGDKEDPKSPAKLIEAQTVSVFDVHHIGNQLKRIADLKEEKLRLEIAKFKFNNPGFEYEF